MPENLSAKRSHHQNQRKRHLAGGSPASSSAIPESNSKNNRHHHSNSNIQDLKDTRIQSRSVLQQQQTNPAPESDMESSLGILSPSDMKSEFVIMQTSNNASGGGGCVDSVINFRNNNNNNENNHQGGGWTSDMIRSRTFTRELNDPKAESELIVEDLEAGIIPKPRKNNNINIRPPSANVKKFKLNTFQIEADEDTRILMSRTESLLRSNKSRNGSNSTMKSSESTAKKSFKKSSNNTTTTTTTTAAAFRHEEQNKTSNIVSDISAETFQSRTEALLHSKTKRKKKKHHR